jgi:hypothetical protein
MPFDNKQIRRFFNDYPALESFEPILCFDAAAASEEPGGEIVAGINRSSVKALRGHRVRFRRKGGVFSVDGGLAFSDTAARWQSRRVDVSYRGAGAHIGNFKQPIPGELALGGFAPLSSLMKLTGGETGAADLLYGGNAAWNGVSVDARKIWGICAVGASAFCHIRPAEAGGGAGVDIGVGKRARVFAGFTGFRLGVAGGGESDGEGGYGDDGAVAAAVDTAAGVNEYYYAHLYAEYKAKGVSASAEAAVPLAGESPTPALSLRLNHRVKGASAEYRAILYPADGAFPMSRLEKRLLAEAGENGRPRPPSVRKHAVRMTVPFISDAAKLIPELDFTESGGVKRIQGRIESRARAGRVDIAAKHTAKVFTTGADSVLHATGASINYRTDWPVAIRASFQSAYGCRKNTKNTYAAEAPTKFVPNAVIVPYVAGERAGKNKYRLGIKSEFNLYKKTWTRVTLEIPVDAEKESNVYVKVSSSYSF